MSVVAHRGGRDRCCARRMRGASAADAWRRTTPSACVQASAARTRSRSLRRRSPPPIWSFASRRRRRPPATTSAPSSTPIARSRRTTRPSRSRGSLAPRRKRRRRTRRSRGHRSRRRSMRRSARRPIARRTISRRSSASRARRSSRPRAAPPIPSASARVSSPRRRSSRRRGCSAAPRVSCRRRLRASPTPRPRWLAREAAREARRDRSGCARSRRRASARSRRLGAPPAPTPIRPTRCSASSRRPARRRRPRAISRPRATSAACRHASLGVQGRQAHARGETSVKELGRVAAAHPTFAVQVVLHDAWRRRRVRASVNQKRGEAVLQALVAGGVPAAKVKVEQAGAKAPVVDPKDARHRERNARVEIVFVSSGSCVAIAGERLGERSGAQTRTQKRRRPARRRDRGLPSCTTRPRLRRRGAPAAARDRSPARGPLPGTSDRDMRPCASHSLRERARVRRAEIDARSVNCAGVGRHVLADALRWAHDACAVVRASPRRAVRARRAHDAGARAVDAARDG